MPIYESKRITRYGRKYYFSCYYTDKYGTRKRYMSKMYLGKRECEKAERSFLEETKYRDLTDYNVMFIDVYNEWLEFKRNKVKQTTFYAFKTRTRKHIIPFFEKYKLHYIKINDVLKWRDNILNINITLQQRNRIITDLKEILEYARDNYDFDNKVVSKVQTVKISSIEKLKDSEWNYITYEEYQQLIELTDNFLYKRMFEFLYYTGLRITEFIALTWNDIDLDKKTVRINKILTTKVDYADYDILPPKTTNSIRTVDLPDNIITMLKKHKNEEKKIYGFNDSMYVFGNIEFIKETTFRRYLNKYVKLAKIKPKNPNYKEGDSILTPHGFRHSHASLLVNLGLDFKDVAERLGDTPKMVESTYYHMFPQKKSNTVNALNNLK